MHILICWRCLAASCKPNRVLHLVFRTLHATRISQDGAIVASPRHRARWVPRGLSVSVSLSPSLPLHLFLPVSPPPPLYLSHHKKGSVQSGLVSIQAAAIFIRVGGVYPHRPQDHNALVTPFAVQPVGFTWCFVRCEKKSHCSCKGKGGVTSHQAEARATHARVSACVGRTFRDFRGYTGLSVRTKSERPTARHQQIARHGRRTRRSVRRTKQRQVLQAYCNDKREIQVVWQSCHAVHTYELSAAFTGYHLWRRVLSACTFEQ